MNVSRGGTLQCHEAQDNVLFSRALKGKVGWNTRGNGRGRD